jgi:branched-chain amino acid transport system substrate-binding protein
VPNGKRRIVAEAPYEATDSTIESEIVNLRASGADLFFDVTSPKFAAQAVKKIAALGWKPVHLLNNISASVGAVLKPAGLDNSKGILTTGYLK